MRPLRIASYRDLHAALRQRIAELGISFATVDAIGGLQDGYAAKLLGPNPQRAMRFDNHSLDFVLGVLGVTLRLVEDPEALARVKSRLVPKRSSQARYASRLAAPINNKSFKVTFLIEAGRRRIAMMTAAERSRLGKTGARARWRRAAEAK